MKSEPNDYSIDDLASEKKASWDGVRNYQARNFMRDDMRVGDKVFFYHSNANPPAIVGLAAVCRESHPDITAFDKNDSHFDPKSKKGNPTWFLVDIQFVKKYKAPVTLTELKSDKKLQGMRLLQRGQRLSVMPIEEKYGKYLETLLK